MTDFQESEKAKEYTPFGSSRMSAIPLTPQLQTCKVHFRTQHVELEDNTFTLF